jgi:sugar lactone lactonase YvrE
MRRVLATLALCSLPLSACGGDDGDGDADRDAAAGSATPAGGSPSPTTPAGVTVTDLDDAPVGVAGVGGGWWAALPDAGAVLTADGETVDVGSLPLRLVTTPQGVWVSVIGDGRLVRVDPATGKVDREVQLRPADSEPEGLAYDGSTLWVVDQAGDRVLPVDPATGEVGAAVPVGHEPRLVATGPSGVFVGNYTEGSVTRVVDGKGTTRNAGSCLSPQGLAEAAGVVWVACTVDGQVVGLDAGTLKPVVELPDLPYADAVVADGDTVYVVGQEGPTVWTIDARAQEVTGEVVLDGAPSTRENVGAALVGDTLVVTHPEVRRAYEVEASALAG